jgi:hypothetical protein
MTAGAERPPKTRRQRSVTESLLSIVLGLEAFLVFFVTLTAFGLKAVDPLVALAGGVSLIAALILAASLLRFRWGIWVGWLLQATLVATGILLPIMFFIAPGFVAIWVYCFSRGRQLDAARAAALVNKTEEAP